jgi:hypothetical protein
MNMRKALFLLTLPALALGACGIGKQKSLDEFASRATRRWSSRPIIR